MPTRRSKKPDPDKRRRRKAKHTVLWVDDDPNVSAGIARRLLRHSIRVVPASDGMQGYWQAITRAPDAIVTDLRMPRWDGEELVDCLARNESTRGIPTIVLSGYLHELSDEYREGLRVQAVLEKPVNLDEVLAELEKCWTPPEEASGGERDPPSLQLA